MRIFIALATMMLINIFLFLFQTGVNYIATDELIQAPVFNNYNNSILKQYDSGNFVLNQSDVASVLPDTASSVSTTSTLFYPFQFMLNWIKSITGGLSYLLNLVSAVPNFLSAMGLPTEISFAFGALWHIITLFLFITWIKS